MRDQQPRPAPVYLKRFSGVERMAHWLLAATFAGMLATGISMGGLGPIGHRAVLISHVCFAVLLVSGVAAMSVLRRHRRRLTETADQLRRISPADRRWLRELPLRLLRRQPLPTAGRFNPGQKMNSQVLLALLAALYLSGLGELGRWVGPLAPLSPLATLHGAAAAAMAAVVAAHIYLAAINPATRHALHGMVQGSVRRDWAIEHHGEWVRELDERAVSRPDRRSDASPQGPG